MRALPLAGLVLLLAGCGDDDLPVDRSDGSTVLPDGALPDPVDGGGEPRTDAFTPTVDGFVPPDDDAFMDETGIRIDGRRVLLDGAPVEFRGVCWSPVARGATQPPDYAGFATQDIALMVAAGIDTVRTYSPIRDRGTLDALHAAGIRVLETVYAYGGNDPEVGLDVVREEMDHPAIFMWVLGNEWNYNGLYTGVPHDEVRARLETLASAIKAIDPSRPVSTIYGELPSTETLAAMPSIDVWGINVYRGITFGDLFDRWAERSGRPMFIGEYGADAWDARTGMENVGAQADATGMLTEAILAESTARHADGVALGGTIFEWSDEWWKDGDGDPNVHDVGGVAPGGGPHPDMTFNEEWWGVVDVDRNPRPAYDALRILFTD